MALSSTFVAASGEGYELQMGRWSRLLAEPFLDFCGCVGDEAVLDVGCGTGRLSSTLAQRGNMRIVGVDLSSEYIDYARSRNRNPQIDYKAADACALPFETPSFDRVLSLLAPPFVPRPAQAVAEMR